MLVSDGARFQLTVHLYSRLSGEPWFHLPARACLRTALDREVPVFQLTVHLYSRLFYLLARACLRTTALDREALQSRQRRSDVVDA